MRRSDLDCVAYIAGDCGVPETVLIRALWYGKTDFSFVKRFTLGGGRFVEARMDLYNVFDNINFTPIGVQTGRLREQLACDGGGARRQRVAGRWWADHQLRAPIQLVGSARGAELKFRPRCILPQCST